MRIVSIFAVLSLVSIQSLSGQQACHRTIHLMGSRFDLTVVADDVDHGELFIHKAVLEISRIERLISSWDPSSQTSEINRNAGIKPVKVDHELFELIRRALAISHLTDGAFDITYASMDKIWRYDGSMEEMPTKEAIRSSVAMVGFEHVILDEQAGTVFLTRPGMKIGFGAIGKGYAADKAKAVLSNVGVSSGIINASGDLTAWGRQPDGSDWTVAITNPLNKSKAFSWLPVRDRAVVTSGNYETFVEFNDKRYSHIIDPRTGYPSSGVVSATVFASSAELADALATSIFVMGAEAGIHLIDQLDGVECIIVDAENTVATSAQISLQSTGN